MGKTDYVLEPILRVLKDGEETPSSEIRLRVADALSLSEAEREYIAPGSPYAEFKYAIAHGLVRLQSLGHLKRVSTEKIYRLTPSGAELAASPRSLSLSDIKNKRVSKGVPIHAPVAQEAASRVGGRAVRNLEAAQHSKADAQALPGGNRRFSIFAWLAGAVLTAVFLAAAWSSIKLLAAVAVLALLGGGRYLRIRREE